MNMRAHGVGHNNSTYGHDDKSISVSCSACILTHKYIFGCYLHIRKG